MRALVIIAASALLAAAPAHSAESRSYGASNFAAELDGTKYGYIRKVGVGTVIPGLVPAPGNSAASYLPQKSAGGGI